MYEYFNAYTQRSIQVITLHLSLTIVDKLKIKYNVMLLFIIQCIPDTCKHQLTLSGKVDHLCSIHIFI